MLSMVYKKTSLLAIFLSLLIFAPHAQTNPYGLPRIQNHHFSETGGGEQNWCITHDFRGVIYVGSHNNGILEYDGMMYTAWKGITGDWSRIKGATGCLWVFIPKAARCLMHIT